MRTREETSHNGGKHKSRDSEDIQGLIGRKSGKIQSKGRPGELRNQKEEAVRAGVCNLGVKSS
jgi:hypothetical protein